MGLARLFQHLLDHHVEAELQSGQRIWVRTDKNKYLIKPIFESNLNEQAYLQVGSFKRLILNDVVRTFRWKDSLYAEIIVNDELYPVDDAMECLDILELYTHHAHVKMLTPPLGISELIDGYHSNYNFSKLRGHKAAAHESLRNVSEYFREQTSSLRPKDTKNFRQGLFHEDLQTGNILLGDDRIHLIDLDPILHTFSIMNLAYFFVMEVLYREQDQLFEPLRNRFLETLVEETARDFDFFVSLSIYRCLIRHAFDKTHYSKNWEEQLIALYQKYAVERYLTRVNHQ